MVVIPDVMAARRGRLVIAVDEPRNGHNHPACAIIPDPDSRARSGRV
jgi:hypothetical protein